jgi:putative nucleotidyltransferase with HDIG domain
LWAAMTREYILDKIKNDNNLLTLPKTISRILEITGNEDYSTDDLANIILMDSLLTARIIQLSRSSYYGRNTKINSLNRAISLIGGKTIKCLALSTSILNTDRISSETGIDSRDFFTYIFSVATTAESIAQIIKYENPEEALIAGLLHDIGTIYLLDNFSMEYGEVVRKLRNGLSILDAEREIFDMDHSELGFNLALSFDLPEDIANAIACHHDYEIIDGDEVLSNIVKLSILITFGQYSNSDEEIEKRMLKTARLADILQINPQQIAEITSKSISRMIEISGIFGVEISNTEELLASANREIWKSYLTIENLFKEREELNRKIIEQQRIEAALEARNEALSTLSHYLNNAIMIISGQSQLISLMRDGNQVDKLMSEIPSRTEEIRKSVDKIIAVMEVLKEVSPLSHDDYFNYSKALNIDDRIEERLKEIGAN